MKKNIILVNLHKNRLQQPALHPIKKFQLLVTSHKFRSF